MQENRAESERGGNWEENAATVTTNIGRILQKYPAKSSV